MESHEANSEKTEQNAQLPTYAEAISPEDAPPDINALSDYKVDPSIFDPTPSASSSQRFVFTSPPPPAPYHPIPEGVDVWYNTHGRGLIITEPGCRDDVIFAASYHNGWKKLRMGRPGVTLFNGINYHFPVLAAALEDDTHVKYKDNWHSWKNFSKDLWYHSTKSVIAMPALPESTDSNGESSSKGKDIEERNMVPEMMVARPIGEEGIGYRFSIEVGEEKKRRETFEWRQGLKGWVPGETSSTGFRLIRIDSSSASASNPQTWQETKGGSSSKGTSNGSLLGTRVEGEVVAVVTFKTWSAPLTKLRFVGSGRGGSHGVLGQRWALMVLVTALRLWFLRTFSGVDRKRYEKGEKFRANYKGKSAQT